MLLPRTYSHHSLLSALPQISKLVASAKEKGYTSIALCDEDTASGLVEFYDVCKKNDIKPIFGSTLRIPNQNSNNTGESLSQKNFSKLVLLAKNQRGYLDILELVSIARTEKDYPVSHLEFVDLKSRIEKNQSLFLLIPGNDHEIANLIRNNREKEAEKVLKKYIENFGVENLLVEFLEKLNSETDTEWQDLNQKLYGICKNLKLKCLPSPANRYLEEEDGEAFRVILAVRDQKRLAEIELSRDFHLPFAKDLKGRYNFLKDYTYPDEAEKQFNIEIRTDYGNKAEESYFPPAELPEGQDFDTRLSWMTYLGLLERFHPDRHSSSYWAEKFPYEKLSELKHFASQIKVDPEKLPAYPKEYWQETTINDYIKQIEYELEIIKNKGYSSYFLVVGDIAQYCRKNNIIATARGSGASSTVTFLNNISVPDAVFYKLPFERFLNPLRPTAPDIDLDVASDKRDQVIQYLVTKYGNERVCQIITFGGLLPRAAIRDIGRALGISYRKCDQIAKLIPPAPFGKKTTFAFAFETSQELAQVYETDDEVKRIIDIAKKIENNYRHASIHAAAVLVTPTKTTDYSAIQWDSDHKLLISQYDWHDCEKVGIMPCKIDILGITNYSILGNALDLVHKRRPGINLDLLAISLSNPKVYELLSKGRTMGVFQLSSAPMTKYLMELKPARIQDLQAMVALYRPGAMAQIPEFIKRRNNNKLVKYFLPQMEDFMKDTYGILVYQEDIMYTFMKLAGYSFGQADNVRRALGKKIKAVLDEEYPKFLEGCQKNNIPEEKVKELWDLIIPFTDYSFNKSHSAAYGIVAYWTAFLKAEYTVEFMTAFMTSEAGDLDKIASAIVECNELGIKVLPPDINISEDSFSIENDQTIRYGLSSVKNLGSDVIKAIIDERQKNGKYKNLDDFIDRICDQANFNKRSLEALIASGSLDNIGKTVF